MTLEVQTETTGQRLRRVRRMRGLSQRELATEHVSYAYISRIEGGARTPSVKALRELAPKLQVSTHYLETGDEDPLWTANRLIMRLLEDRRRLRRQATALRLRATELERASTTDGVEADLYRAVREAAEMVINRKEAE